MRELDSLMPFDIIAKLGRRDVLKNVPGVQTRKNVEDIVLEVIRGRRTIREFQGRPVSDEILMKLLEAARYAPSAGNQQPWETSWCAPAPSHPSHRSNSSRN